MVKVEHLGDITKLNGYELPAVDVVIGGSPIWVTKHHFGRKV